MYTDNSLEYIIVSKTIISTEPDNIDIKVNGFLKANPQAYYINSSLVVHDFGGVINYITTIIYKKKMNYEK